MIHRPPFAVLRCFVLLLLAGILAPCPAGAAASAPASAISPASPGADVPPVVVTPTMRRYARTRYALYFAGTFYEWALLWGVLASGLSARLRAWAERVTQRRFLQLAAYYAGLTALLTAAQFPLTWYSGFWMERQYGLSGQSGASWLGDWAKGTLVDYAVAVPVLALVLWLIGKSPRRWSGWLWAALVPLIACGIFLVPLVIDPLFNHFTPLPPGPLRTRIETLAAQAGIPHAPIYVADKSRQTRTANAYVTGLGSSARIVIWDTTLKQLPDDEVLGIVAHEMGHYVLKHVLWGFAETVTGLLILLPLAQRMAERDAAYWAARGHIRGLSDMAAVPVLLLTLSVLSFLCDPITNALSRRVEHQADAYGLAATHNGSAMARAFAYFAAHDLSDPNPPPFIKFWLFTHPPINERINFVLGRDAAGRKSGAKRRR